MKKYDVIEKEIKNDDGTTMNYKVLVKYGSANVVDADSGKKYGVQRIEKSSIWFPIEDKEDIIEALNSF